MGKSLQNSHFYFFFGLFLTFLLFLTTTFSQQILENGTSSHPEILNYSSPTRTIIDLAGQWNYSFEEESHWQMVKIPVAFDYEGKITFTRKFTVDEKSITEKSFKLVAYGINDQAEIYVNETFIGKHEGGYTSFSFLIPENIIQVGQENTIRIVTDNRLNAKTTLPLRQQIGGWKNYGGIFRDIFIVATPKIWIDNAIISTESIEPKGVKLSIQTVISAKEFSSLFSSQKFTVEIEAIEKSTGTVVAKNPPQPLTPEVNRDVSLLQSIFIPNAKLWNLDSPELYTIKIILSSVEEKKSTLLDEYTVDTGIRTIVKEKNKILFNGVSIILQGIIYHEDSPKFGNAISYTEMENDILAIKNLGVNVIRFAFHSPHPYFLTLCDKYGILVFQEISLYEIPEPIFANDNYKSIAENRLKEMIQRDKNHPSIIAWGVGDGVELSSNRENNIITELHRIAKSLDTRLTYCVVRGRYVNDNVGITDITAITPPQELTSYKKMLEEWKQNFPNEPLVVGNYGKKIVVGNRSGYSDPTSQEAQARFLLQHYNVLKEVKATGGFISSFADWQSARPMMALKLENPYLSTYGIVEYNREKKIAYNVVRSMYFNEKVMALPVGAYIPESPTVYVVVGLVLLILFAWIYNSNRRFREGVNRSLFRTYNFFADIRDQRSLTIFHTTLLLCIVSVTFGLVVSSLLYHYKTNFLWDYILSHFIYSDSLKTFLISLSWNPMKAVAYISLIALLKLLLLTVLIQLFSFFVKTKVYFFHSYSITIWATLPIIIFIPLGMIMFRILESEMYVLPIIILFAIIIVWIFLRTLKGISVIYDVYSLKIYSITFITLLILSIALYAYLDYEYSTTAYIRFFFNVIVPSNT